MATSLTPPNLTPVTTLADADLLVAWPSAAGGPLSKITWSNTKIQLRTQLADAYLSIAQNLADLGNVGTARINLELKSAALVDVGTSGNTLGLLSTINTHVAGQIFQTRAFIDGAAGTGRYLFFSTGGLARWEVGVNNTAEATGSVGSDFAIQAWDNAGAVNTAWLVLNRKTGLLQLLAYNAPGVLTNDGSGNITTTPLFTTANTWIQGQDFNTYLTVSGNVGANRYIRFRTGTGGRWEQGINGLAEGGANAGSNFYMGPYADDGTTYIGDAFRITRATRLQQWPPYNSPSLIRVDVGGNVLNDLPFAAGSWTPTISVGTWTIAYTTQAGRFTRFGDMVFVDCTVIFTPSGTAGSGALFIAGIPYNFSTLGQINSTTLTMGAMVGFSTWTGPLYVSGNVANGTTFRIFSETNGSILSIGAAHLTSGLSAQISFAGWYKTGAV